MARPPLDDNPTAGDCLGRGAAADLLAERLLLAETPYVLGVHGEWGAGKSSFLRLLDDRIAKRTAGGRHVVRVKVTPWRNGADEQPATVLLRAVRSAFLMDERIMESAKKSFSVALFGAFRVLSDAATVIASGGAAKLGAGSVAREELDRWEREHFETLPPSESLATAIGEAVKTLVQDQGRVVFLIDDLDRCPDGGVVRVLEAIKLYLEVQRCVFVLACDREAIVRAVQRELFGGKPDDHDAAALRSRARAEGYVEKFFMSAELLSALRDGSSLIEASWWAGNDLGKREVVKFERLYGVIPPHPRAVKRFLTELGSRADQFEARYKGVVIDWELLALVQALQTFHPRLYRVLVTWPAWWGQLATHCQTPPTPPGSSPTAALHPWPHDPLEHLHVPPDLPPPPGVTGPPGTVPKDVHDPSDPRLFRPGRAFRGMPDIGGDPLTLRRHLLVEPPA